MNKLIYSMFMTLILIVSAFEAKADCDEMYIVIGSGYKFDYDKQITDKDNNVIFTDHRSPYSARMELGVDCGNLRYGISHHSQWSTGFPFNNIKEPYKTEFFIDYKFSWGI